jgi:hypothetical protein
MDGLCGEKFLPDVYMRTAAFKAFVESKHPVIAPFSGKRGGTFGSAISKIVGAARVGNTVTCKVPKLGGDPYKLSYTWSVSKNSGLVEIPGRTMQTLKVTDAVYRFSIKESRRLFCTATARNGGGSLAMFSGSVPLKKQ